MRRVDKFILVLSEINGIICHTAQITAPPVEIVIILILRVEITVLFDIRRIDFDSLNHDQDIWILGKYNRCRFLCHIAPVILIF